LNRPSARFDGSLVQPVEPPVLNGSNRVKSTQTTQITMWCNGNSYHREPFNQGSKPTTSYFSTRIFNPAHPLLFFSLPCARAATRRSNRGSEARFYSGFQSKPGGPNGFLRFYCTSDLLSRPNRRRLWFAVFPVEPAVWSSPNFYGRECPLRCRGAGEAHLELGADFVVGAERRPG
jgi:hypothetical protein